MSKLKKSEAFTREREREIEQVSSLFVICLYAQCYIHTLLFELKKINHGHNFLLYYLHST